MIITIYLPLCLAPAPLSLPYCIRSNNPFFSRKTVLLLIVHCHKMLSCYRWSWIECKPVSDILVLDTMVIGVYQLQHSPLKCFLVDIIK